MQRNDTSADLRPGSDEAIAAGCKCPVLDNAHGKGWLGMGGVYVMREDCPIHGRIEHTEASDGPRTMG